MESVAAKLILGAAGVIAGLIGWARRMTLSGKIQALESSVDRLEKRVAYLEGSKVRRISG